MEKKPQGGDRRSIRHDVGLKGETAARLAKEHGVTARTIERDGKFADAVESASKQIPGIENLVKGGERQVKRSTFIAAAERMAIDPSVTASMKEMFTRPGKVASSPPAPPKAPDAEAVAKQKRLNEMGEAHSGLCTFILKLRRLGSARRTEFWNTSKEVQAQARKILGLLREDIETWESEIQ